MREREEWRLFYRYVGTHGWERWSGGAKPSRAPWDAVAEGDAARRRREGLRPCEYAVRRRTVTDYPFLPVEVEHGN